LVRSGGGKNWFDKTSVERDLTYRSKRGWLSFFAHPEEHWREGIA